MEISLKMLWVVVTGFAQNRNAFAFQLLMILCATIALSLPRGLSTAILAIALAALWATGSRAGFGATSVVLAVALYMRAITPKQIAMALAGALGIVLAIILVDVLAVLLETGFGSLPFRNKSGLATFSLPTDSTNTERLRSLLGGIDLFRAHPFFGAGLGSFMASEIRMGRAPLVIHSTPIWLLAELGLVGLCIFVAPAFRKFWSEIRRRTPDTSAFLLVMIIGGFAVMSLVHEMLYQRTLWLLLGAALASPVVARRSG
jgi:O-antigen ligase